MEPRGQEITMWSESTDVMTQTSHGNNISYLRWCQLGAKRLQSNGVECHVFHRKTQCAVCHVHHQVKHSKYWRSTRAEVDKARRAGDV